MSFTQTEITLIKVITKFFSYFRPDSMVAKQHHLWWYCFSTQKRRRVLLELM